MDGGPHPPATPVTKKAASKDAAFFPPPRWLVTLRPELQPEQQELPLLS